MSNVSRAAKIIGAAVTAALSLIAPVATLTATRDTLAGSWTAVTGATGYRVRYRMQSDRPTGGAYDPFTWEWLVPFTRSTSFSSIGALWPGVAYDVQVAALDVLEAPGPWQTLTVTAASFLPPRIGRHNADLTQKEVWKPDSGVTVTRVATGASDNGPYTRVAFSAASQALSGYIPVQSLNGRSMTVRVKLRSTDGSSNTIGISLANPGASDYYDFPTNGANSSAKVVSITGAWTEYTFTRPFTTNGRTMTLGIHTYNSAGLRSVDVEYHDVVETGTANATAAVVKVQGDVLQEPALFTTDSSGIPLSTDPTSPTVWTGHHASTDRTVPAVDQVGGSLWCQGNFLTGQGDLARGISGYPLYLAVTNARMWIKKPTVAGASAGKPVRTAYASGTVVENCWIRGGIGILIQFRRPMATIASGIFSSGNFRVRYNRGRDQDGRLSDGAGGYIRSNYSNIQNRPPGCPQGYTIANFCQLLGQNSETAETIPPIVEWNENANRPGFALLEDDKSHIQIRGTGVGYPFDNGLPYKTSHNFSAWACVPWDFLWHDANDPTRPYSYSGVMTTFNLLMTVTSATAAASGVTNIPLSASLNLNKASIAAGTVLTTSSGKQVTLASAISGNATSINVTSVPTGGLAAGETITINGVQDNPGQYSGSNNLMSDGYTGDPTVAGNNILQSRYGLAVQNVGVGPGCIHSTQAGMDILHVAPEVVNTPTMMDGVVPHDGSKTGYGFIVTFGETTRQGKDASGVYQNVYGRNAIVGMIGTGVAVADGRAQLNANIAAGAATLVLNVGFPDPLLPGTPLTFRDSNKNSLGTATVGPAGVAPFGTSVPITGLSGAQTAGVYVWATNGDSFKPLLTRDWATTGPDQNTHQYALRRWQTWRDQMTASGLTLGPAA